jgi:hypothetical protein
MDRDNPDELMSPMDKMQYFHDANSRRLEALESNMMKVVEGLATVASNTSCIPALVSRIDSLESDRDKAKGRSDLLLWLCTINGGGLGAWVLAHWKW